MKCTLTPYLTTAFALRVAGEPVKDREHLQRRNQSISNSSYLASLTKSPASVAAAGYL